MREIFFEVLRPRWHHIPPLGNEGAYAIYQFVSAMMDWVNILYYPQIETYINTQTKDTDMLDEAVDDDSETNWRDMPPISDEAAYAICEFGTAIADWIKIVYSPQAEDYLNLQPEDVDVPDAVVDEGNENSFDFDDDILF